MAVDYITKADFYKFENEFKMFKGHVESEIGNNFTPGNINRNLTELQSDVKKMTTAYYGNGQPGIKTDLLIIKEGFKKAEANRTWFNRLVVSTLIINLVGFAFMLIKNT